MKAIKEIEGHRVFIPFISFIPVQFLRGHTASLRETSSGWWNWIQETGPVCFRCIDPWKDRRLVLRVPHKPPAGQVKRPPSVVSPFRNKKRDDVDQQHPKRCRGGDKTKLTERTDDECL